MYLTSLRVYNSNRDNPRKLQLLNETLLVFMNTIKEGFLTDEPEATPPEAEDKEVIDSTERAAKRTKKETN